jgi:8-oxo-dGTP pyrophosphatase MutT (NUDIX family)
MRVMLHDRQLYRRIGANLAEVMTSSVRRRQQYGALPTAEIGGEIKVLLVTSRETRRWVIPKGWAEEDLTPSGLAAKEAYEEAGAVGEVTPEPIGCYSYSKRLKDGSRLTCEVQVFRMRVDHLLQEWPERSQRERRWFTSGQAAERVAEAGLIELLGAFTPRSHGS